MKKIILLLLLFLFGFAIQTSSVDLSATEHTELINVEGIYYIYYRVNLYNDTGRTMATGFIAALEDRDGNICEESVITTQGPYMEPGEKGVWSMIFPVPNEMIDEYPYGHCETVVQPLEGCDGKEAI